MKTKLLKKVRRHYYFVLAYLHEFDKTVQILRLMSNDSEYAIDVTDVKDNDIDSAKKELLHCLIKRLRSRYPELGHFNKKHKSKVLPLTFKSE